jgi:hypothetical protein
MRRNTSSRRRRHPSVARAWRPKLHPRNPRTQWLFMFMSLKFCLNSILLNN